MFAIDSLFKNYKIFIDTSAFMHAGAQDVFIKTFPRYLSNYNTKIIVPVRVINELERYQSNHDKSDIAKKALLSIIREYQKVNLIDIKGESGDSFSDNLFQTVFTKFRIQHNLCLITQDKNLAIDICNLKKSKSVKTNKGIICLYISDINFSLEDWQNKLDYEIFRPSSEFYSPITTNTILNVSSIPDINDTVFIGQTYVPVRLIQEIGKGGEGKVYLTENNCCCKIYKKEKITREKIDKIKLMLNKPVKRKGICWPKALVYNLNKEFVGYFMDS